MPAVPILMYHNIASPPPGARLRSLYVPPTTFARHMRLLRFLGFHGLSMGDALPYLTGKRNGKVAAITLDDGYADAVEAALPILLSHRFTATCYVVSGYLSRHNEWDEAVVQVRKRTMDASQIRMWLSSGMEVGSHTRTHPHLPGCSAAQLANEIAGSKKELEDRFGAPVNQFCYPYGDWNARVREEVRSAEYRAATTTRRGRARPGDDLFSLRRVLIGGHNLLPVVALKLVTMYEDTRR